LGWIYSYIASWSRTDRCTVWLAAASVNSVVGTPRASCAGPLADVFGPPAGALDGEAFWGQNRIEIVGGGIESVRRLTVHKSDIRSSL
jgi:hypothetical protein